MKPNNIFAIFIISTLVVLVKALRGGELAKPGEFPHAVQLSSAETGEFFCGGSILSSTVILTAAHCLYFISLDPVLFAQEMPATGIKVTAGKSLKGEKKSDQEQIRNVTRYVIHPEFNLFNHDLALVFLNKPLDFTKSLKPILLPAPDAAYSRGIVAGWGHTDGRNLSSDWLKKVNLELEKMCDEEVEYSSFHVKGTQLCSKPNQEAGLCKGDSGSGLVCLRKLPLELNGNGVDAPVICGIASRSRSKGICDEKINGENVFVDVSKYLNWIHYEIKTKKEENISEFCSLEDRKNLLELNLGAGSVIQNKLLFELKKANRKIWCVLYSVGISALVSIIISVYCSTFFNETYSNLAFQFLFVFSFLFLSVPLGNLVVWID